jgi:hypothetical protein
MKKRSENSSSLTPEVVSSPSKKIGAHLTSKHIDPTSVDRGPTPTIEQFQSIVDVMSSHVTRRDVLKAGAASAVIAALPSSAWAMGFESWRKRGEKKRTGEWRTFVFDFSWCDTGNHDVVLVAGVDRHKLKRTSPGKLKRLRKKYPVLNWLPSHVMTHHIDLEMPSDSVQWCYVKRSVRGAKDGRWDQLMMFIHHPISALRAAAKKEKELLGYAENPKVANKWRKYGLTGRDVAELNDPEALDSFKDSCDTACTMISGHPEMLSMGANSSAYIQNTITSQNSGTLGEFIAFQGPAEPQANWVDCNTEFEANPTGYATLVPVCDPDTGEQARNTSGDLQYMPEYSDTTNGSLNSDGIMPSLATAKQDTTLGGNITSTPEGTAGLIWRTQDGVTTSVQDDSTLQADRLSYITKDFSPGHGYSATVTSVDDAPSESSLEAVVTIDVQNWFVRYLGLYVRYLDGEGKIITPDDITSEIGVDTLNTYFPFNGFGLSTPSEMYLDLLFPEFEIFGIPTSETKKTLQIPVPKSASSFVLLASGMGATSQASNPFASSAMFGQTMTGVLSMGLPFFFLTLAAASAVAPFTKSLTSPSNLRTFLPLIVTGFEDAFITTQLDNPSSFKGLGVKVGTALGAKAIKPFMTFIAGFIEEAETEQAVLDAIPFVGAAYSAIVAAGTLAQLAQTAVEVIISPSTYAFEVLLTHDIEVTVRPNLSPPPDGDPDGWPATATHFDVTALFDGGTPTTISTTLSLTTNTDPVTITFQDVPLGGQVAMSVGVYSDNDFLVGTANSQTVSNEENVSFDITFKEVLLPLTETTVYSHKEVIELDSAGNHIWVATTTPPTQAPKGCSPSNGQLCALNGITINTAAAGLGQSFQSYNDAVPTCTNVSSFSNGHQFSNISSAADPQSEFIFSGCTFSGSPRLVYDLMSRPDNNFYLDTASTGPNYQGVIRQVRLDKNNNPGFDGPDSNLAWGKLQHPSSSLLLHPGGKIVSIANTKNKFEVIDLPDTAMSDAAAPFSHTYSAQGLRPGLMDGPVHAALDPDGTILVLEAGNKRIQAFDLNGNSAPIFPNNAYFVPLKDQPVKQYLDFAIEFKGYMFVLSIVDNFGSDEFTLDIYTPDGVWLSSTTGFKAQRLAVNYWRDVFTQNSQVLTLPSGAVPARTEPSISHWIPSTP